MRVRKSTAAALDDGAAAAVWRGDGFMVAPMQGRDATTTRFHGNHPETGEGNAGMDD
jgi:hypothetical protein